MKLLKYLNLAIFIFLISTLTFTEVVYFSKEKKVIDWRIKNIKNMYSKVDDVYLVNQNYSLKEICDLTKLQKKSVFNHICLFINGEISILNNDDKTLEGLRLLLVNPNYVKEIPHFNKLKIIELLSTKESNEYNVLYKEYLLTKLK